VVNNAGAIRKKPFLEHSAEDLAAMIAVHQAGSFFVSQAAFEVMMNQRYGRFVFTTSVGGLRGNQYVAAYGSAKAGIVGLAYVVGLAGAPYGIAANVISPYGHTRMANAPLTPSQPGHGAAVRPELVSPVVVYLASEECKLNHEILTAGGGAVARTIIALGRGWRAGPSQEISPEAVRDNLEQIMDVAQFSNPLTSDDEGALFLGPAMAAQRR
jgi:NAD(P)-dependent dehydrogenase (short-subunit alcohol dehydrogenase family)